MAEIVWAESALEDLDAIADYIAFENPAAARRLVQRVFSKVEHLREFPRMGSIPPEIPDLTYRQILVLPCRIFYRPAANKVYILHVMRGERLLRSEILGQRDFEI